jgi:hypothetical protein
MGCNVKTGTDPRPGWQKTWRTKQVERGMHYLTMWVAKEDVAAIKAYAQKLTRARKRTQALEPSRD